MQQSSPQPAKPEPPQPDAPKLTQPAEPKLTQPAAPAASRRLDAAAIAATLPHADPFLFIEEATLEPGLIRGRYTISGREDFLRGHFKGRPVFPASIMLEALGQLGVLYLLSAEDPDLEKPVDPEKIFFTSCDGVRCSRVTTPGETLEMVVRPKRLRHPAAAFEGSISVGGVKTVFAEKISLVFDYRDTTAQAQ